MQLHHRYRETPRGTLTCPRQEENPRRGRLARERVGY